MACSVLESRPLEAGEAQSLQANRLVTTGSWTTEFRDLCKTGSPEAIVAAMQGRDINTIAWEGSSRAAPLHLVAGGNAHPPTIEGLVRAGADVEALSSCGLTPLMIAAMENQNPAVVQALLDAGARADFRSRPHLSRSKGGYTALEMAEQCCRNPDVLKVLRNASAR